VKITGPHKVLDTIITVLAVALSTYHLIATQMIIQTPVRHRDTFLLTALLLVFLSALKTTPRKWRPLIYFFILLSVVPTVYVYVFHDRLVWKMIPLNQLEIALGIMLVVAVFEASRRSFGMALPSVILIFVAYTFFGQYLPYPLWHIALSLRQMIESFSLSFQEGVLGNLMALMANFLFLFIVFGSILQATGTIEFFRGVGELFGRRSAAGPGMTAVVSSALVGTISGSGAANVAITGSFTIPLMKKVGYSPEQAAAIESTASTGGNLTPPVMGIVAFVMAEYSGIPYAKIILYAAIPALLYYFSVALYVQFNARKLKLKPRPTQVDKRMLAIRAPTFFIPITLLVFLLVQGYSLGFCIFWAIIALVVISMLRKETRGTPKIWLKAITDGAMMGAKLGVVIGLTSLVVSTMYITGLASKLSSVIQIFTGGELLLVLIMLGAIVLVLGSAVPPFASYLIAASMGVPVLLKMGIPLASAHFFVYYFAVVALITPPIGYCTIVAASLAESAYMRSAVEAVKAALVAWLLPFLAIFVPIVILQPMESQLAAPKLIAVIIAIVFLQGATVGYYIVRTNAGTRSLAAITAAALLGFIFTANYISLAIGLALGVFLTLWQLRARRSLASTETAG
jgi:TRAP transporter 4TM/12TM fusion protein